MEDSNETQALARISNVVTESQLKIILNNQCNKAQYFLINKLKKESERLQELCNSIYQANTILDSEIKTAQDEIKSLFAAEVTLKAANVDLRKELLIVKDKPNIVERNKEASYERLWIESKIRYESIPVVKTYIETNKRAENTRNELYELQNKVEKLNEEIVAKKRDIVTTDKKRIVELAYFIQNEMPSKLKLIEEKKQQISHLTKEKERLSNKTENDLNIYILNKNNYETNNEENNELFNKLSIGKDFIDNSLLVKKIESEIAINEIDKEFTKPYLDNKKQLSETTKTDDYMRIYFKKTSYKVPVETQRYPKRKLIDILEDVKIDKKDAFGFISKAKIEKLQRVNSINPDVSGLKKPLLSEEIEEIDMSFNENLVMPPTQFVDVTGAEPMDDNKEVSPDTSASKNIKEIDEVINTNPDLEDKVIDDKANESINSVVEDGNLFDNSSRIKEIMLRREKLSLSPQFVYGRNTNIMEDRSTVTSKFFKRDELASLVTDTFKNNNENASNVDGPVNSVVNRTFESLNKNTNKENIVAMDVDEVSVKSKKPNKPITGLFTHTSQGLPASLNISMNTTGFEDGDADYAYCIDSNLLLSPTADIPNENHTEPSKEVSNFLSGLKKGTVFPFFEQTQAIESIPDKNAQNQSNQFCFTFGSQEKKNRSTLFNMFQ
ncbi:hypothetical protein K1T71_007684 [Dendrolimus kikuchii]|uniref:Uncharacterized protein n=1 Tax=Dendrolimus kikuchii TaxID=765133 RepID=A0ACC1CXZ0_9NEOP|nr:hypothetical protein K1T71_007684 [Dendrolimus kikuchii]